MPASPTCVKAELVSTNGWRHCCDARHNLRQNLTATRKSFDICGGFNALQALKDDGAPANQAEAVAEAIIRHQDMSADGAITYIDQPIHFATLYNNLCRHSRVSERLIRRKTRREVNEAWPRLGWCH
ncbi:cyanamide hydratase family HD domain-containing protein [Colletotrichum limetticola]|uniref:Cyanamide hydratase family HD domain-containing protein n=1 Tax=Colletotrichum limetticola TaxID=1209924 RepID=A0ABQ9QF45_9PEZI|nr:cyanamide hydratase family HD domain-containing protein [Colletotrichum limetticola]